MKDSPSKRRRLSLQAFILLSRSINALSEGVHAPLRDYNLSTSQFGVLEALFHLGSLSQKQLAEKILKSPGNLTLVIDNLIQRGLVSRETDATDRRKHTITLSVEGQRLIREMIEPHKARIEAQLKGLTLQDLQELIRIGKKLTRKSPSALL